MEDTKNLPIVVKYYGVKNGINIDLTKDVLIVCAGDDCSIMAWNIEDKLPQPSMEELEALVPEAKLYYAREQKDAELSRKFDKALVDGHCMSSLGFEIDANVDSLRNTKGLLDIMSETDKEMFCDYYNEFHEVTRPQVKMMELEITLFIKSCYNKKWYYRGLINNASTAEEVEAIVIEF